MENGKSAAKAIHTVAHQGLLSASFRQGQGTSSSSSAFPQQRTAAGSTEQLDMDLEGAGASALQQQEEDVQPGSLAGSSQQHSAAYSSQASLPGGSPFFGSPMSYFFRDPGAMMSRSRSQEIEPLMVRTCAAGRGREGPHAPWEWWWGGGLCAREGGGKDVLGKLSGRL